MNTAAPTKYRPVEIINRTLQKPWMIITSYDISFDNWLSIQKRIEKLEALEKQTISGREGIQQKIMHLKTQCEGISDHLRNMDEMIHDYIKGHQE